MTDYTAHILDIKLHLAKVERERPANILINFDGAVNTYYLMRGYRTLTSDYETWVATGSPNSNNPSGQPIINITIQVQWSI